LIRKYFRFRGKVSSDTTDIIVHQKIFKEAFQGIYISGRCCCICGDGKKSFQVAEKYLLKNYIYWNTYTISCLKCLKTAKKEKGGIKWMKQ